MKKETEVNHLLECIEKIYEAAHSSKLKDFPHDSITPYTKDLAKYLGSTERQAFWFAIMFSISLSHTEIDLESIATYLRCSILTVFKYINLFDELVKLKVLKKSKSDRRRRRAPERMDNIRFYVPTNIIKSISDGETQLPKSKKSDMTVYEFLDCYANLLHERDNELLNYEEFIEASRELITDNKHLSMLKQLKGFKLDSTNLCLLLYVCTVFTDYSEGDLIYFLKTFFPETQDQMAVRREFLNGKNKLQVLKLVDTLSDNFRSDRTIALSEYAKDLLFGEDKDLFVTQEERKSDIILSSDIIPKKLFFNKKEQESLEFVSDLLKPDNFQSVCSRMKDMGLRTGFTILLHGPPGTGKTESCLQLAAGGRSIYKVEIAETKSKWFGESERLIKGLFERYARLVQKHDIAPIMLLNECDGILGKRQLGSHSSVSQTENAIQNLFLENIEQLNDGSILIATTNLTENLDAAFERRFLYKIELKKPDKDTRCLIWKDKIPRLTDLEYQALADSYELSGGQIENISRKYLLKQILSGVNLNLSQLMELCQEEFLGKTGERRRIGFLV